jgi:anti-anti-sigma factor
VDDSRVRISVVGDVLLASFSGELQGPAASHFEDELVAASKTAARSILLDLRDVPSIDGAGLALLIDAARRARAQQQHLCVLSSPEVYGTFCGTGLIQAFCNTGLLQAVELVHPCTLDVLTRLGWLHGTGGRVPH